MRVRQGMCSLALAVFISVVLKVHVKKTGFGVTRVRMQYFGHSSGLRFGNRHILVFNCNYSILQTLSRPAKDRNLAFLVETPKPQTPTLCRNP